MKKFKLIKKYIFFINIYILIPLFLFLILFIMIFQVTNKNKVTKSYLHSKVKENSLLSISKSYDNNATKIIFNDNIIESAIPYSVPAKDVEKMISNKYYKDDKKIVFLTFDDGPSVNNTPKILKILKDNNVHGTFFVVGSHFENNETLQNLVRLELENGNAIGNHTFYHNLKTLYPNNKIDTNEVLKEIDLTNTLLKSILGPSFNSRVFRLPGGYLSRVFYNDENLEEFNEAIKKKNIVSLDWDTESGDADPTFQMNVSKQIEIATEKAGKEKHIIILMHDCGARVDTVEALPHIIKFYKDRGYEFKVIRNSTIDSFTNVPIDDVKNLDGLFPPLF